MADREMADLRGALNAHLANPGEFENLLLSHFGHARTQDGLVAFQHRSDTGEHGEDALRVRFSTAGKTFGAILSIEAGPALKDGDIHEIAGKVESHLAQGPLTVARTVIFSFVPCLGAYRFKDKFQILPAPESWPRPRNSILDPQPLILESSFHNSDDHTVRLARMLRSERVVELLLSLLLFPGIRTISRSTQFHWVYMPDYQTSEFLQEGYMAPGAPSDSFTDLTGLAALEEVPANTYYAQHGIGAGDVLKIPSVLTAAFECFDALDPEARERFLRACYWYQQAVTARHHSRSISFMAMVSAIESLIPPTSGERCGACGKDKGPGPTRKFSDFVEHYLPEAIPSAERTKFYGMRSALTHGGQLLHSDEERWGMGFAGVAERVSRDTLSQITRLVVLNWLLSTGA